QRRSSRRRARSRGPASHPFQGESMSRSVVCRLLAAAVLLSPAALAAEEKKDNPAAKPLNRDNERHKKFLEIAKKGNVDVLFLGDSITQGWEGAGKEAWKKHFEPLKAAN